uniref:Uncharacterized protein n=1 Tax=Arundo donax TaxID=35708 RepID=A0A0A9DGY5_ARUDO
MKKKYTDSRFKLQGLDVFCYLCLQEIVNNITSTNTKHVGICKHIRNCVS